MAVEMLMPHNTEAEMGVLGALLIDPEAIAQVAEFLTPDDFDTAAHRTIFGAALDLYEAGAPADFITLCDELARRGTLDAVGGTAYVGSLANQVPTSRNATHYARIVERTAILRRLIHAGSQVVNVAYHEPDADAAMEQAEQLVFDVGQRARAGRRNETRHIGAALSPFMDRLDALEAARRAGQTLVGVPTGIPALDRGLGGLRRTNLAILAAYTSQGKSALALTIAHNAARAGRAVAFFSLEMSLDEVTQRLVALEAGVDLDHLDRGDLSDDERLLVARALARLSELPLYLDDTAGLTLAAARAKLRRLALERPVDLAIFDYLQLMQSGGGNGGSGDNGRRQETREQEVAALSRGLKLLAGELDIPVLALAQLSRAVMARQDKRPQLSDLRESGSIENDANVVLLLSREETWNPETERRHIADVQVAKNRNGPQFATELYYDAARTHFRGLAVHDTPTPEPAHAYAGASDYEQDG